MRVFYSRSHSTVAFLLVLWQTLPHVLECLSQWKPLPLPLTMVVLVAASATSAATFPVPPPLWQIVSIMNYNGTRARQKSSLAILLPSSSCSRQSARRQQQQQTPLPSRLPSTSCHALLAGAILQLTVSPAVWWAGRNAGNRKTLDLFYALFT